VQPPVFQMCIYNGLLVQELLTAVLQGNFYEWHIWKHRNVQILDNGTPNIRSRKHLFRREIILHSFSCAKSLELS
jgi:hypothetical protein